jgi:predicted HTH domain antitoxin
MISIEIPEEVASQLRLPPKQIEGQLKQELAIHLVREGICASAQGARLAQMSRLAFERLLGERKIPWAGTIDDVKRDLDALNSL